MMIRQLENPLTLDSNLLQWMLNLVYLNVGQ